MIVKTVIEFCAWIAGTVLLWFATDWRAVLAVLLLITANNLMQRNNK